jgi:two-component system phosphate regulon sensor histidine kinase PhoR
MLRTYAARYSVIAFFTAVVFVVTHAVFDFIELNVAFTWNTWWQSIGWGDLLVITTPLSFTAFAYVAGRQRDRAAAQARYLNGINRILRTLTHSLDLDQTLPAALQEVVRALQVDDALLYLFDRDQLALRATTPHTPEPLLNIVKHIQMEQWLPVLLPKVEGQQIVALDIERDVPVPDDVRQLHYRQMFSILLLQEAQEMGLLLIAARLRAPLSPEQADFLITAANQIGAAIARTRPYAEVKRRARDLEAIAQVNRTLLAGMGLDDLLETIVNAAQVRFGLPYVAVLWVDEAAEEFFVRAHAGPLAAAAPHAHRQKLTQGLAARVYRTGQPYLARDVRSEPDFISRSAASVLSSLLVPMKVSGKVIGIMGFDSLGLDAFSEADVAALTTLADQTTIAAENARLYAEAQRERRRVAAILRSTRDVVMLIDPAGCVQLMNPAAERVLGLSAAEGVGRPIERVLIQPVLIEAYRWMSNRPADEDAQPREVALNSGATYLVTVTSAKDETNAFFGRVVVMQDISYLKELDQFKTQMIQMVSHDLRNPLGVAMGYVELLTDELRPMTPIRQQEMTGLDRALTRMQNLVTDLLSMERIEAGADRPHEPIEIGPLVEEVAAEFSEQARVKRQAFEVSLAPGLPPVMGDAVRLKQALSNLVGNAIKYTPDAGRVWVRLTRDDQRVVFEVQDTGYGISKAAQAKLFQRFYRAKTRGTENIEGTGLGLSLVKAVIEQHGGRVSVESDEGQGSTFRAELPIANQTSDIGH